MRSRILFVFILISFRSLSQDEPVDSVVVDLDPVLVQAFATQRPLEEVAASVGYIDTKALERFSNTSILPAVNTVPGVRMEERSPGSYRFSIRGSLLRSPFGVRNVKVYWNGLPFTDGGGNTYLNLVDFSSIGSMEIIKGPGGSLYGAGTGGVLLLKSPVVSRDQIQLLAMTGSYGLQRYSISGQIHREKFNAKIQYSRQSSDGYREQTKMSRDAVNADLSWNLSPQTTLAATLLYSDLFYETPGGLTQAQYNENAKQARPAGGPNRGAVEQEAAVTNKTPYVGLSLEHHWNNQWTTTVGAFGSASTFKNPTIRNFEERDEKNFGARTETQFAFGKEKKSRITFGGEFQTFKSPINIYGNSFGARDTAQTSDELSSNLLMFFGQAEYDLPKNFFLTIGASLSFTHYGFTRTSPVAVNASRDLDPAFSPRIALLNRITPGLSVFASMSKGFSPPGLAELFPSRAVWDNNIQPEQGTNLELGFKGHRFQHSLEFDLSVYQFKLKETLVIRRDENGADYFVNAGETLQKGIEALIAWHPIRNAKTIVRDLRISNSYTLNDYKFDSYIQGTNDYSGKLLTGIPPVVNTSSIDITVWKFYLNATALYSDHTPLDDANSVYANEYFLLGGRLGWKSNINAHQLELFAGIDNALDKKYSLGNDLNAVGGRFFNAAPGRNFYGGLKLNFVR